MANYIIGDRKALADKTKGKKVFIYGSGVYGRTLLFFLKEHEISDVIGFVVTEKYQCEQVFSKQVYSLEEYASFEDVESLLIIGVSEKHWEAVIKNIECSDCHNILQLSDECWDYILRNTSFSNTNPGKNIAILMYHRVDDDTNDLWRLNVSHKSFERQISYISHNYEVLRLEEDWTVKVHSQKKYVIITFDDGYADNYMDALPILEKYKVPATFFVPTDLIGTKDMFWWDELEELLIKDEYSGVVRFDEKEMPVENERDRRDVCREIRNRLKNMQPDEIKEKMNEIRSCMHQEKRRTERLRCVSYDELEKLAESEYASIGGHTKSHLSMGDNMPYEIMMEEVQESLHILESITKKKITTFAFPFGGKDDYCDLAEKALCENGISKAVIVKPGNIESSDSGYELPRHMMFDDDDIEFKLNRIWGIYG